MEEGAAVLGGKLAGGELAPDPPDRRLGGHDEGYLEAGQAPDPARQVDLDPFETGAGSVETMISSEAGGIPAVRPYLKDS